MNSETYIVNLTPFFGGAEAFLVKLVALLRGHARLVIVSPPLLPLQSGLARHEAGFVELSARGRLARHRAFLGWLWRQRTVLRQQKAVIVLNGRAPAYWAPFVRILCGCAPVVIRHTEIASRRSDAKEWLFGIAARFARCVVSVSETVAAQHRLRWPATAVQAIPNWIDGTFTDSPEKWGDLASSGAALRLAAVGRLAPAKGVEDVVTACTGLSGIELHVYGDGPLRDRLRTMAHGTPWVHLHGHVHDLVQRLPAHALFVSGSHSESFSYAVAEGIQAGMLCVISDIPAHREMLGPDYPDALFFPPGDVQALQYALRAAQSLVRQGRGAIIREAIGQARQRIQIRQAPEVARKSYLTVLYTPQATA